MLNSKLEQAHSDLVRELGEARRTFPTNKQHGVTMVAAALLEFVGETVIDLELHVPLIELVGALIDATEGRANPLLKAAANIPRSNRTHIANDVDNGRAAAVVTLLIQAGDTQDAAAVKVSRALNSKLSKNQIIDMRKRITRGNGAHKANGNTVGNYDGVIANAKLFVDAGFSKQRVATEALEFLSETTA